jgi:hypothetical protein
VLGAAAEFERELIRERSKAGRARYLQDYRAGRVGKTVRSRSGKNLPPHRPKRIFDRDRVDQLRAQGLSIRQIAAKLGIGVGTAARTLQVVPEVLLATGRSSSRAVKWNTKGRLAPKQSLQMAEEERISRMRARKNADNRRCQLVELAIIRVGLIDE